MKTPMFLKLTLFAAAIIMAGCTATHQSVVKAKPVSPGSQLANTYRPPMSGSVVRVAVLPVAGDVQPIESLRELDRTFQAEFSKPQIFEGVRVTRSELAEIIHREQISSTEAIPQELIQALQQKYSSQAVLLTDITHYRPYRPISISVRTKLVSLKNNDVLWSTDANFDSAEPAIAEAARNYSKLTEQNPMLLKASDSSGVLLSPQRFARFVAREVFSGLPSRVLPTE